MTQVIVGLTSVLIDQAWNKRIFHALDCGYVRQMIQTRTMTAEEAERRGLRPCRKCIGMRIK